MRRLLLLGSLVAAFSACFAPRPCTLALCPSKVDGIYAVKGWNRTVTASSAPDAPAIPVVSDSEVEVLSGRVSFVNGKTLLTADSGTSFRFEISTSSAKTPSVTVSSGSVQVSLSSAAPFAVGPGAPYLLPVPK